jgi:hypothetical protein
MKAKLKHIFFLASLSFAAMACGGSTAKPLSGLDVSLLPASLLTISPKPADSEELESATLKIESEAKDNITTASDRTAKRSSPRNFPVNHQPSTISNQQ